MGVSIGCPNFLGTPIISGTGKATDFIYTASTFTGPIRIKAHKNFGEKGAWAYPGAAQTFGYPLLSQERVKLRTSNFVGTCIGRSERKPMKNFGNSSCGRSQGVSKIFRAPTYRAHCAAIFAIVQLSHEVPH